MPRPKKQKDITTLNSDIVDSLDAVFKSRLMTISEKAEALRDAITEAQLLISHLMFNHEREQERDN